MKSAFQLVVGLWISPDLEPEWRGATPHYVDHDALDYRALADFLDRHFYCGEPVALRMPNDTVDHLTARHRLQSVQPSLAKCNDFAEQLLQAAAGGQNPIPVRRAWGAMHLHKDRRRAPPPALIMFLIEGAFEAVTIWHAQASMRLGIRAADLSVLLSGVMTDSDHAGQLTDELSAELEDRFGAPYGPDCMLAKMVSTRPPTWATRAAEA